MKEARLCVVDGTYELFRAYFGAPSRLAPDGREVGAAISVGRSLAALAQRGEFTHLAVAFDTVIESFRNRLFDGYKTGEGIEPNLLAQFPLVERVVAAHGLRVLSMVEFEADDALASAAAQFGSEVDQVVIASPDKDLMQCIRAGVVTWDRMRERIYDEIGVKEKLGVIPRLVPDYLALVGDSADGIPGVPRWGAKSAALALSRFGHLEEIPRTAAAWDVKLRGLESLLEELRTHEEEVLLYRTLATLREDVDLGQSLDDLRYRGPDEGALRLLSDELGTQLRA
jgi:5'-3' exonuclease